jgi:glycosyltransferase involved in cell wall biosynthesis
MLDRPARRASSRSTHRWWTSNTAIARWWTGPLAVSRPLGEWLAGLPEARGRVHVVPNAVDPARFPVGRRPSHPAPPGIFTVGFLGSLKPWHGLEVLAEAYGRLCELRPGFRLLVVGDGPARAAFEAALALRGARGDVEMTGAVAPADVPGLLASMDAAVAPYPDGKDFYFSPLKVYEYMAAGLAVVASRFGPLEETIHDGVTGLLCPPGDAAALTTALLDLADKPRLRAALGQAARRAVLADHTWARRAERILALARTLAPAAQAPAEMAGRH